MNKTMFKRTSTYSINEQNILEKPVAMAFSKASGELKVFFNNHKVKQGPRKTKKPKKRSQSLLKNANDWNRLYRKAIETANNNFFADNVRNTWYITLTIKDPHIKEVNTVRKWIKEYEKTFSEKVFILGFIELDKYHHPHVHMLLTTIKRSSSELITDSEVENNWKYGFVALKKPSESKYFNNMVAYHKEYIARIVNYSIKTWSKGSKVVTDPEAIKKYELIMERLKRIQNIYRKKSTLIESNNKWKKKLKRAHSLYLLAKAKYKRELQVQMTVKDKPLYISYGKQKPSRTNNPTKEDIELVNTKFKFRGIRSFTLRKVNNDTGEIINCFHQHTKYYDPK